MQKEYDKNQIVFGMTLGSTGEVSTDGGETSAPGVKHRVTT